MLLIQAALVGYGVYLQYRPESGGSVLPQGRNILPFYLSIIALEWALVATVRGAIKNKGISLWELIGGRWKSWKDAFLDVGIFVPFVGVWEGSAWLLHRVLGPDSARSVDTMLPRSALEIALWIVVSLSAGICEEIVYRGYFQKQFAAYTNSVAAAVVLQGIVFGVAHSYQGAKQDIIISVLGIVYGLLAVWRTNLRVNMMAHAWSDIWSGWLSGVLR
jgi:hypothetical protein